MSGSCMYYIHLYAAFVLLNKSCRTSGVGTGRGAKTGQWSVWQQCCSCQLGQVLPSVPLCICWLWSWVSCTVLALHEAFLIHPGLLSQNWPRYKLQCAVCCNGLLQPLSEGVIISDHHSRPLKGRRNGVCNKCCSWKYSSWKARLHMYLKTLSLSCLASRSV